MKKTKISTAAVHEAGHVVMRWLCGLPLVGVSIASDMEGFCNGTEKPIDVSSALRVSLAGFAAEVGYRGESIDFAKSDTNDFREAMEILDRCSHLRATIVDDKVEFSTAEDAVKRWFVSVCEDLKEFRDLVDVIAIQLQHSKKLGAEEVNRIIDEHYPDD